MGFQPRNLLGDQAPVGFDLRFAGSAHDTKAAALPLKVCPGPDEPRAFIGESCELDLQFAFPRSSPPGEDLQNETCPVDDLQVPGFFQIPLLDGRQGVVDDNDIGLERLPPLPDLRDLAAPEQCRGHSLPKGHDVCARKLEIQRARKTNGLFESTLRRSAAQRRMRPSWMQHQDPLNDGTTINQFASAQSSPSPSAPGS